MLQDAASSATFCFFFSALDLVGEDEIGSENKKYLFKRVFFMLTKLKRTVIMMHLTHDFYGLFDEKNSWSLDLIQSCILGGFKLVIKSNSRKNSYTN